MLVQGAGDLVTTDNTDFLTTDCTDFTDKAPSSAGNPSLSSVPSVVISSAPSELLVPAAGGLGDSAAAVSRARLEWLDFYRGLAVLVMIETHVSNTFLANAVWPTEWRGGLDYVNGLVAPAFLFIAGYAHGLGLRRKRAVRTHMGRRLIRLAGIAAIGYALHFPWTELLAARWTDAVRAGTRMDILPCLALSIAALILIERACGRWVKIGVAVMAVAVLIAAPRLADWSAATAPIVAMMNQSTGSLFPLLPWAAFVFAGFLMSELRPAFRDFGAPVAAALVAVAVLGRADLSPVSAAFFFERLAWILVLVPVCGWLSAKWPPKLVLFVGSESLAIYVAHLLLISLLVALGLAHLGWPATAALLAGVIAVSVAAAWGWRAVNVARADRARRAAHLPKSSAPAA